MRCRDGTRLISRLWHPPGPREASPVLLMRQPYGRAIASTVTYAPPHWYARQGFLVVVQDVRGRGESEGHFRGFAQEAADGADAVRWARQLPEANGRLGMYGFSYQGLTQLLNDGNAGANGPATTVDADGAIGADRIDPLPDCLAPAMCGLDERLHWASEGGAHWWGLGLGWALQLAAQGLVRRGNSEGWLEIRRSLTSGAFLEEGPELLQRHDPAGMGLAWLRRSCADAADWSWAVHQPPLALLKRPMLLLGGWWDPHLRGVLDLWHRSREAGGDPDLCIGPWSHLNWSGGQPLPAGAGAGEGLSIDQLQLAFFRHHLDPDGGGGGPAAQPGTAIPSLLHDLGTGTWLQAPPTRVLGGAWQLSSSGLASVMAGEGRLLPVGDTTAPAAADGGAAGMVWLVHDPWRPLPGRGGHLGLDAGPSRRDDLDARTDVACFSTAPLLDALTLMGEPVLELLVEADQPGFDLCCALSVLRAARPDQPAEVHQLSTGFRRVLGEEARDRRRHRVRFQPLVLTLQPGERLRLSVAAAAWPQLAVNPGTGATPMGGSGPEHRVITLTLELAGSRLSMNRMVGPD